MMLIEAFIFFSATPALALVGVIPYQFRWYPALLVTALVLFRIIKDRWSWQQLGLNLTDWHWSLVWHSVLTVVGALILIQLMPVLQPGWTVIDLSWYLVPLSLLVSFLQELVFRAFMIGRLERQGLRPYQILLISSFTFAFIHTFFKEHMWVYMGLCFIYGWALGWLYMRYRNLIMATFSHFCLNLLSLYLGLI